jgi:hypothetical protein
MAAMSEWTQSPASGGFPWDVDFGILEWMLVGDGSHGSNFDGNPLESLPEARQSLQVPLDTGQSSGARPFEKDNERQQVQEATTDTSSVPLTRRETGWPFHWNPRAIDSVENFPNQDLEADDVYEIEDFDHVGAMHPSSYAEIENFFCFSREIAGVNHKAFMNNAKLPPIEAMNSFIQLYFEYFHPSFPMLHRPTFETSTAKWVLVLGIAGLGCRYSVSRSSCQYGNLLRELLRQAIPHMVTHRLWLLRCLRKTSTFVSPRWHD